MSDRPNLPWLRPSEASNCVSVVISRSREVTILDSELPRAVPWGRYAEHRTIPDDFELFVCGCGANRLLYRLRDHMVELCRECARRKARSRQSARASHATRLRRTIAMLCTVRPEIPFDTPRLGGKTYAGQLQDIVKNLLGHKRNLTV